MSGASEDILADDPHWPLAERRVLAKLLGELVYEGVLRPVPLTEGNDGGFLVELASGARYRFAARRSIWSSLDVDPLSVTHLRDDGEAPAGCAAFLVDARQELRLNDITAGHLLEEIHNTIFSEAAQRRRLATTNAEAMADLAGAALDPLLDAHPKAVANRGRLGWGASELAAYAPESAAPFPLRWLAVRRGGARVVLAPQVEPLSLLRTCMAETDLADLRTRAAARGLDLDQDTVLPVHPWQWDRYIRPQYAPLLASGALVDLGVRGDRYLPQQSIRTLANIDRPTSPDVKLAVSILNTSCHRGIPAKFVEAGSAISGWVADIAARDPFLVERGTVVLRDLAGVHCPHPAYASVPDAPYRYHELLGAVWRESAPARVRTGERVVPAAALYQCDLEGRPLLAEYVRRSGLSVERWLTAFFERAAVPLYHLLCRHGLGIIAHGQNLGLVLDADRPHGMVLKDFHGDVRLVDRPLDEFRTLPPAASAALTRLPSAHLLHDLYTGHFVTVLRFVSSIAERKLGFPERTFYRLLAGALRRYQDENPALAERFAMFDLFRPQMERICINRARFRIGYGDSSERPLPDLGDPLENPLATSDHDEGAPP
ncbi:IucA/IucC family protein [Chondromyces crocatus]|uniref:IucA/IucC family protein n=1 Tax=Chondromyces crocatus TaxID=52 RepID=A0A0K1EBH6_CHOCO|nr:IucA/IucC family protein [Chondromyces crocatus]AKT38199.1 IucA/IucC family protein [Chondromyces crocatus]